MGVRVLETIAEPNMEYGTISKVKVANKVDELLHAEAIRVVEAMPKWTPGKQNGKEVRVKYKQSICKKERFLSLRKESFFCIFARLIVL